MSDWCSVRSMPNGCTASGKAVTDLSCGICRSWTYASNIANQKLRLIGLDGAPVRGDTNSSHNYMVAASLNTTFDLSEGKNWKLSLLPAVVPPLKGSTLWSNTANSTVFTYGGRAASAANVPSGNDIPTLDAKTDKWSNKASLISIQRLTDGVSLNVPALSKAFYIGGYQSNYTSQSAAKDGLNRYTTSMFQFDTNTSSPSQLSAPFLPSQFGAASYIPVNTGALVYFGGESPPTVNVKNTANFTVNAWDHAWIYDINANKWYRQNTTGSAAPRTEFCTSTLYDSITKSWQIWAIGGADFKKSNVVSTVSILSIPSFQWFKASDAITRMSLACESVGSQIFVIGGRQANTVTGGDDYNQIAAIYDANQQKIVSTYNPTSTSYAAPSSIRAAIATKSTPATWGNPALKALMISNTTTPTDVPSPGEVNGGSNGLPGGAIAGIVVGAVLFLMAIIGLIWFLLQRRKPTEKTNIHESQPFVQERTELDAQDTQKKLVKDVAELPSESHTVHEMDVPSDNVEVGNNSYPKVTKPVEVHELGSP